MIVMLMKNLKDLDSTRPSWNLDLRPFYNYGYSFFMLKVEGEVRMKRTKQKWRIG